MNSAETSSRENLFARDTGEVLLEILQKLDFASGAGREVRRSAFGGRSDVTLPVPEEHGLSQSRASRNQGFVRVELGSDFIQKEKILRFQSIDSPSGGHEIVHENNILAVQIQGAGKRCRLELPGKIDGVQTAADYRSSNAESGRGNGNAPRFPEVCVRRLNERAKQMLEIGEIPGCIAGLKYRTQSCARLPE